jgi:hypothetical protein
MVASAADGSMDASERQLATVTEPDNVETRSSHAPSITSEMTEQPRVDVASNHNRPESEDLLKADATRISCVARVCTCQPDCFTTPTTPHQRLTGISLCFSS